MAEKVEIEWREGREDKVEEEEADEEAEEVTIASPSNFFGDELWVGIGGWISPKDNPT